MAVERIFGLDAARAFAISLVVLAHLNQGTQAVGIYGVELFFALSGFLIGSILFRNVPATSPWAFGGVVNFWQRRWWRTLPAFYLFLVIAILHHGFRGEWPEGGWAGILPYLIFAPNLMSPNEVFYDVSWSLCVEEFFYLSFPLLLFLFQRIVRSRERTFVAAISLVVVLGIVLREIAFASWPSAQARVMTLPRIDAVAYGVLMALMMATRGFSVAERKNLAVIGAVIATAIASVHFVIRPAEEATWFFRVALILMPFSFSLMMPLLAAWNTLPIVLERFRGPITAISLWSYTIYLCHHMTLMAIYPLFGEWHEHFVVKLLSKVVGLVVILLVSRFVYRYFESPLTKKRPPERALESEI